MGWRSSLHENIVRVKTLIGSEQFEVSSFFQYFIEFLKITEFLEVASNLLKIGQRVAYEWAVIATRAFYARQNSYGFRAI